MSDTEPSSARPLPVLGFQGEPGAYSHLACRKYYPDYEPRAYRTFEDVFAATQTGGVSLAMIPIENSLAGRVADIHHLLPDSGLYIVGERFLPVEHQLLAAPDTQIEDLKVISSHAMALGQCRNVIRELGAVARATADTAGAARELSESRDPTLGVIASALAAETYGLKILRANVEDASHNTTRFVVMSREPDDAPSGDGPVVTSFIFRVRNIPAALYKAMGGFATNGVNMTKLESYQLGGAFHATQFYADIEGHPEEGSVRLALEELNYFSSELRILGVYPADPYRNRNG